jgi:SAM-dependent methyltransferase
MPAPSQTPTEAKRRHFEVERELADRLRKSTREERPRLVPELYGELYRRVPDHPRIQRMQDAAAAERSLANQWRLLEPYLTESVRMVEFGAGDGGLSRRVAERLPAAQVTALEVCEQAERTGPPNLRWVAHDGFEVPLASGAFDLAFSYQVLEHIHPDDVAEHFRQAARVLRPGGVYVLSVPHEASGPHDVSRYFGDALQTFHLKEWSYSEVERMMRAAGFGKIRPYWRGHVRAQGGAVHLALKALEGVFKLLPGSWGRKWARRCRNNVIVAGEKAVPAIAGLENN